LKDIEELPGVSHQIETIDSLLVSRASIVIPAKQRGCELAESIDQPWRRALVGIVATESDTELVEKIGDDGH